MKISKLFHWLYAIVMLLPIFAIGVTCGYAMFNKNAYQSYAGIQETQTTNIDTNTYNSETMYNYKYKAPSASNTSVVSFSYISITASDLNISQDVYDTLNTYSLRSNNYVWFGDGITNNKVQKSLTLDIFKNFNFIGSKVINTFTVFDVTFVNVVQAKISDVFYYSIDKVQQSPLFNWAENSFLVTPFAYIVNLFSMPSNSVIVMLLSYWLAISIIWLVFDLIMYVPLLVHRWLDKGVLE